jgi:uncharacterized protein
VAPESAGASAAHIDWTEGFPVSAGPRLLGLTEASPETQGFWDGVAEGRLRVKRCAECRQYLHPRRIVCSRCQSTNLVWEDASGRGTIYTYSEVYRAPQPALEESVPYVVGIVELAEGVHLFSRLFAPENARLAIGAPVQVEFRVLETGMKLPVFAVATNDRAE